MSLLGFLTGAASLFGGGGGGGSQSSSSKSTTNSSGTQAVIGSSDTTQKGTQTTTGSSTTTGTIAGTEAATGSNRTTNYSSDVLASLDSLLKSALGGGATSAATDALSGRLQQIQAQAGQPGFNVDNYVSGIAAQATAATQSNLDERINSVLSLTGSSETGNSMAALLGNRLRNEAGANLAGVISTARAQGEQIAQGQQESLTAQISGLSSDITNQLATLLGAAKGGVQDTTSKSTATNTQDSSSKTGSTQTETLTGSTSTKESGVTEVDQTSTTTKKGKIKTSNGNGLFDKLASALGAASKAA